MLRSTPNSTPARSRFSWVLRVTAWALVLGCGLGLMSRSDSGSANTKLLTAGVWTGLGIYLLVLMVDLITRLRGVRRRAAGMEGGQ